GPGAMEAANRGAQEAGGLSVGLGIDLPHEQQMNRYLDLAYEFDHFYARKVCFVKPSEGFVVLPGGVGTLAETFEALTLIQTGKAAMFPVVLLDSGYWDGLLDWLREPVLATGKISPADLQLVQTADDPDEAARIVIDHYARKTGQRPATSARRSTPERGRARSFGATLGRAARTPRPPPPRPQPPPPPPSPPPGSRRLFSP